MTAFIQNLRYNWHLMRIVRFGFGIFAAFQAYETHDPLLALIGGVFFLQGLTNTGCAGGSCGIPPRG